MKLRQLICASVLFFAVQSILMGEQPEGSTAGVVSGTGSNTCAGATLVQVPVGPVGNPLTMTILGNNTPATGPDCLPVFDIARPIWWEAIQITQAATITVDLCGTTPVQDPSYQVLTRGCGFPNQFCTGPTPPNESGRGAPHCADGNAWATFTNLQPGIYRIPIFSDSSVLQNGRGPYVVNISASACPGSCCHLNEHTCDDCADPNTCNGPGDEFHFGQTCAQVECAAVIGPDTIVGFVWDCRHLGRIGPIGSGTVAMSCNTTACNKGDMRGDWLALPDTNHPVIGVNLYRSESVAGATHFEQIGQGWLKHGFGSSNDDECGFGCTPGAPFEQIGVGCSDTYSGLQFESCNLGPRSMINPYTGVMPGGPDLGPMFDCGQFTSDPTNYPANDHRNHVHSPISHKVQVQESDLPAPNHVDARYFAEGFYIAPHEFLQGNGNQNNNVSHVELSVSGPNGNGEYDYNEAGPYFSESPALDAWTGASKSMIEPAPLADGRAFVAWEVTDLGAGQWHYEYAIYNMNLDASIGSLCVPLAPGVNVSNVGFHAPLNHAPELHADTYNNVPWTPTITADAIRWDTESFSTNPSANAVRFGTLYNFRFDANLPPQSVSGVAGLFKTGGLKAVATQGPSPANLEDNNSDGIPDVCEPAIPSMPEPASFPQSKSRFISFRVPSSTVAGAAETALRVKLVSLHHVEPPYAGGPTVPFTSFEGQVRWVGPHTTYVECPACGVPGFIASLQCTPYYQDWSSIAAIYGGFIPNLHVTGSAIVPSSIYEVQNVAASCAGIEASCTAVSAPLTISTIRWADVAAPFNPPSLTAQPDVADIAALVAKFRQDLGAPIKPRVLLAGNDAFGNFNMATLVNDMNFTHIAACVDAFRGKEYPHTIAACP